LFPFETHSFRRLFKATCVNLGISERYVPHSLRHGGATRYHHVKGWSIEDVLERGRWASVKSARRYIQSGVAMLMSMAAPVHINKIAIGMARDPYRHIITSYLNSKNSA
jgi:integrase